MRRPTLIIAAIAAALLAGCRPEKTQAVLPPNLRVDTFPQTSAGAIDILWVVDNSGSMAPRQENLAKNFSAFIDLFVKGAIDYRIAVTTTDIFVTQGQFVGNPKVLSPATANVTSAFATNVRVGTSGSAYEAGMAGAKMALDRVANENAPKYQQIASCQAGCGANITCQDACPAKFPIDFLRKGAYLYIIFVSDEEDESSEDVRFYYRYFEDVKGIGNDGTVTTAAIMGDVPTNPCGATPGVRYDTLSKLTGGLVGSICDTNFSNTLKALATNAVGLKRKFVLSEKPNPQTIKVIVHYPCGTSDDLIKAECPTIDRTKCDGAAADALGVDCTPAQGGADGWSYEAENNDVFFAGDSVPGLHSSIELQYYPEGLGP